MRKRFLNQLYDEASGSIKKGDREAVVKKFRILSFLNDIVLDECVMERIFALYPQGILNEFYALLKDVVINEASVLRAVHTLSDRESTTKEKLDLLRKMGRLTEDLNEKKILQDIAYAVDRPLVWARYSEAEYQFERNHIPATIKGITDFIDCMEDAGMFDDYDENLWRAKQLYSEKYGVCMDDL